MTAALYVVITLVATVDARTDRPLRIPRPDEVGLMLDRLLTELPQFFGYYNVIFLAKAALATVALSAVGSVTGSLVGLLLPSRG